MYYQSELYFWSLTSPIPRLLNQFLSMILQESFHLSTLSNFHYFFSLTSLKRDFFNRGSLLFWSPLYHLFYCFARTMSACDKNNDIIYNQIPIYPLIFFYRRFVKKIFLIKTLHMYLIPIVKVNRKKYSSRWVSVIFSLPI